MKEAGDDSETLSEALVYAAEMKTTAESEGAKCIAAAEIIKSLTGGKAAMTVEQAIAAALVKYPSLSESKSLFEGCATVEKVNDVAESLAKLGKLTAVVSDPSKPTPGTKLTSEGNTNKGSSTQQPINESTPRSVRIGSSMRIEAGPELIGRG